MGFVCTYNEQTWRVLVLRVLYNKRRGNVIVYVDVCCNRLLLLVHLQTKDFKKVLTRAPFTPSSAQGGRTCRHSVEKKRHACVDGPTGEGEIKKARAHNPYGCG
jgi:hypothetical protein